MKTNNNLPLNIGTVVRLASADRRTRDLGIIKAVRAGSALFPGWHYDIAWSGRGIDRAVSDAAVTVA